MLLGNFVANDVLCLRQAVLSTEHAVEGQPLGWMSKRGSFEEEKLIGVMEL